MFIFRVLCLISVMGLATNSSAQTFTESNQQALSAYSSGNIEAALALTRQVTDQGVEAGRGDPLAYLFAMNNLTFLALSGAAPSEDPVGLAAAALGFAQETEQISGEAWLTAMLNAARATALAGDRVASRSYRTDALTQARGTVLHPQIVTTAVDLAFLNHDHTDLPPLIEETLVTAGGYFAQTDLEQLFVRQEKLEALGDIDGVSALVDARILLVGAIEPLALEEFSHAVLWQKFFMNYDAENFGAAAEALRVWAGTGTLSGDEAAFIAEQAEHSLILTQLNGYGDHDGVQLGYAQLTLAFAQIAYAAEDHRIGLALRQVAAARGALGQYELANAVLQEAILNLTLTPEGQRSVFLVLEDLASNAWQRGALQQSAQLFDQAEQAYAFALDAGTEPLAAKDRSILAANRAQLLIELPDLERAAASLAQAEQDFNEFVQGGAAKSNDLWHYVTLAEVEARLTAERGDTAEIREATLAVVEAANAYYPVNHPRRVKVLTNAADQLLVINEPTMAQALLIEAFGIASEVFAFDAPLVAEIEFKLAQAALLRGERDVAIGHLRHVAEARRSPEHRVELSDVAFNFELLAWALLGQPDPTRGDVDEALAALQWTQVSQSAEALSMMDARLSAADPQVAVLLKRRQDVVGAMELGRSALNAAYANGGSIDALLDRQRRLSGEAAEADEALRFAAVAFTGQAPITPVGLSDIQALLGPGEVLVTFVLPGLSPDAVPGLEQSSNTAIAIRSDGYVVAPVGEISRDGLNRTIDAFRCEMAIGEAGCTFDSLANLRGSMNLSAPSEETFGFDWTTAHTLYENLFGGIDPLFQSQDHLIIVPPSDLLRLPFQALITAPQPQFDLGGADWLVRHHPISILPSIAAFQSLRSNKAEPAADLRILGVGDPVIGSAPDLDCESYDLASLRAVEATNESLYGEAMQEGLRLANPQQLRAWSRLPDATCELQAVGAGFGAEQSDLLLRADATETRLKAMSDTGELARYDIMVFATHGVVSGATSAVSPGLVMTPPTTASVLDDGLLTAAEVATLTLNARLVILSACNTAAGRDAAEEGLSGLASGFFQAGARSLMVTHWAVFSSASAEISSSVALALAEDTSVPNSVALQRAILSVLDDDTRSAAAKHPSYWAPFAIVGG